MSFSTVDIQPSLLSHNSTTGGGGGVVRVGSRVMRGRLSTVRRNELSSFKVVNEIQVGTPQPYYKKQKSSKTNPEVQFARVLFNLKVFNYVS